MILDSTLIAILCSLSLESMRAQGCVLAESTSLLLLMTINFLWYSIIPAEGHLAKLNAL